jgi:hypothetical protein
MTEQPCELCERFNALPLDLQRKILSYLDIDRRRALGVFAKMGQIPCTLATRLQAIPIIVVENPMVFYAEPGFYVIEHNVYTKFTFIVTYTNKPTENYGMRFVAEMCQ